MTIGVAYERKAARITIVLGEERWEYVDRRVSVDKDRGVVQVYGGDRNTLVATAPLAATVIEWVAEAEARLPQGGRARPRPWTGAPARELDRAVDEWFRRVGA